MSDHAAMGHHDHAAMGHHEHMMSMESKPTNIDHSMHNHHMQPSDNGSQGMVHHMMSMAVS